MDVDLYTEEVIADPWPTLTRIREAGPVVWNERGYWMSGRDQVCRRIFADAETFTVKPIVPSVFGDEAFISIDDIARHNKLRRVWANTFRRDAVQTLRTLVRGIADDMLDPLIDRLNSGESVDLVDGICRHLPGYVVTSLLGIPHAMRDEVVRWSDLIAGSTADGYDIDFNTNKRWLAGEGAKREMAHYLIDQVRYRRKHPGEDLISQIVHSEVGATLSDEAIMINARLLLFGGSETSANWLGHIFHTLARRPDIRRQLNENPSLIPATAGEILRWEPVVHALPRSVQGGEVTIDDVTLPDGAPVVILLGAANRDPRRYGRPDELEIGRDTDSTLAFGLGLHKCIGMYLACLEAEQTTTALLDRAPDYELTGDISYSGFTVRGPSTVPIVIGRNRAEERSSTTSEAVATGREERIT